MTHIDMHHQTYQINIEYETAASRDGRYVFRFTERIRHFRVNRGCLPSVSVPTNRPPPCTDSTYNNNSAKIAIKYETAATPNDLVRGGVRSDPRPFRWLRSLRLFATVGDVCRFGTWRRAVGGCRKRRAVAKNIPKMADSICKKLYLPIRGGAVAIRGRFGGFVFYVYFGTFGVLCRFGTRRRAVGGSRKRRMAAKIKPEMADSSRKKQYIPTRWSPQRPAGVSAVSYSMSIWYFWCCM